NERSFWSTIISVESHCAPDFEQEFTLDSTQLNMQIFENLTIRSRESGVIAWTAVHHLFWKIVSHTPPHNKVHVVLVTRSKNSLKFQWLPSQHSAEGIQD